MYRGAPHIISARLLTLEALVRARSEFASWIARVFLTTALARCGGGEARTQPRVGPAVRLGFMVQRANVSAGIPINPAVHVSVQDAQGNVVTSSTASITMAITSGTGTAGAVLGGTLTQTTVNGVAMFANLAVDTAGTSYTLSATSGTLMSATSTPFTITALTSGQAYLQPQTHPPYSIAPTHHST